MDLTIESQYTEADFRRRWWRMTLAYSAPRLVVCGLYFLIIVSFGIYCQIHWHKTGASIVYLALAGVFALAVFFAYLRAWRKSRSLLQRQGCFEHPIHIHLTDRFLESSCGENQSKCEYRVATHYLCMKDCIALLHKNDFLSVIARKYFPDGGEEWMHCLENNGVKKLRVWGIRRWWITLLFLLLVALALLLPRVAPHDHEGYAKRTACVSNLKLLNIGLTMYKDENEGHLPPSLDALLKWNADFLHDDLEKYSRCPLTGREYKFIPYTSEADSDSAPFRPILLDEPGCHQIRTRSLFKKSISSQTPILFSDGHVYVELNDRRDYLDIYEAFSDYLSPEDAELLKKCCESWNQKYQETE